MVDDEKNIRHTLRAMLLSWGHDVVAAASVDEAIAELRAKPFDFMLTDFKLDNRNGIDLIRESNAIAGTPISAVMTAFASFENAVNAIKEGAYDYLTKPFSNAQLEHLLKRVATLVELKREYERLRRIHGHPEFFSGQTSSAMTRLEEFVRKVAPTDASVLLTGESGTGKSALAQLIHHQSPRSEQVFRVLDCRTTAGSLTDAELLDRLESAHRGTILFEEIGELTLAAQARLSRLLQDKSIERGGVSRVLDVRIVASTQRPLEEFVREGKFQEDLCYRLNVFECSLVPLRYRREDLPVLILKLYRELSGAPPGAAPIGDAVQKSLLAYGWPGNTRELKNVMERLVLLSRGREPRLDDLPDTIREGPKRREGFTAGEPLRSLEELERDHVERVLRLEPNQEKAAQILGITTVTLWRKRKQYGLP